MSAPKQLMPKGSDISVNAHSPATDAQFVADYIDKEGPAIHSAFGEPSQFDKQRAIYRSSPWHHDLKAALEGYGSGQIQGVNLDFDTQHCTWGDVLDEAAKAEKIYLESSNGPRNVVRKVFRFVGDYSESISPWIDLIPDQDGLSILNGGLKLIFRAIAEQAKSRIKIMAMFREIPDIIRTSEEKRRIFKSHQRLERCCIDLYRTLLDAIRDLILLLTDNGIRKNIKAFAKGSLSGKNVDEVLERVNSSFSVLQKCVDDVRDEKASGTFSTVQRIETEAKATRLNMKNTEVGVKGVAITTSNIASKINDVAADMEVLLLLAKEIRDDKQRIYDEHSRTNAFVIDAKNALLNLLREELRKPCANPVSVSSGHKSSSFLNLSRFLDVLAASPMGIASHVDANNDLEHMLRQGRNININDQSQALSLLQTQEFQKWIASQHSTILLVDGNMDSAVGRVSPMSLLCASLVLSVLDHRPAISLHYFCGLHVASNSPLYGPAGLIRSLLMQLLLVSKVIHVDGKLLNIDHTIFNLNFIDNRLYREDLESHNIAALCHTFKLLIDQLPMDITVFCIIDSINLYERPEWLDDLVQIVNCLNQITQDTRLRPIFKLLMTSARTSRYVQQHIEPQQRVRIRQGRGDGNGITQRSVMSAATRPKLLPEPVPHRPGYWDMSDEDDSDGEEYEYQSTRATRSHDND